jgi:pimeloyl-ACP methyl ester carboxylesterase
MLRDRSNEARYKALPGLGRLLVCLAASLGSGATCAAIVVDAKAGETLPSRTYTQPQQRVSITPSRKINLFCIGTGTPVVLLDAGAGFDMLLWRHVQGRVARQTRVCAYDRAGYGFSDGSDAPLDADHVSEDLHRLIASVAIKGPVVYVGHSIAGLYAVKLRAAHPQDIVGAVLVDPAFVGQFGRMTEAFSAGSRAGLLRAFADHLSELKQCRDLARDGALGKPVGNVAKGCVDTKDYPEPLDASFRAALTLQNGQPKVTEALFSEYSSLLAQGTMSTVNDKQIGGTPVSFGNLPLLVLTHGNAEPLLPGTSGIDTATSSEAWRDGHAGLARTSTRGELRVIASTGHFIQLDDPDAVAAAITEVVRSVRDGRL